MRLDNPASVEISKRFSELKLITAQPTVDKECHHLAIESWLDRCEHHTRCGGRDPRPLPTRLVDFSDSSNLRIFEPQQGDRGRYVALSYCWGEKKDNKSVHELKLPKLNLKDLKKSIDQAKMTLTHSDGIQVARKLGYQYIWIDALCIMQDDNSDWEREALAVPDIYGNADLTIMAGRSDDSRRGFLDLGNWYEPAAIPIEIPYKPFKVKKKGEASCWIGLPRSDEVGPVERRAWCFQEAMLSRRVVTYGMEQLIFDCRQTRLYECKVQRTNRSAWYDLAVVKIPPYPQSLGNATGIYREWYLMIEGYAKRKFFDPTDCFAALSGVARQFQNALAIQTGSAPPRYLAGLWETDMIQGLMWRSSRIDRRLHYTNLHKSQQDLDMNNTKALQKPNKSGKVVGIAPSWSWMALEGPITVSRVPTNKDSCCFPTNEDGSWASRDWGVDKVLYEHFSKDLPFKINVTGFVRPVRVSATPINSDYLVHIRPSLHLQVASAQTSLRNFPLDLSAEQLKNMEEHGVMLECSMSGSQRIIATALFDVAEGNPSKVWAMPVFSASGYPGEGLLLGQKTSQRFVRLGVFWAKDCEGFLNVARQNITIE